MEGEATALDREDGEEGGSRRQAAKVEIVRHLDVLDRAVRSQYDVVPGFLSMIFCICYTSANHIFSNLYLHLLIVNKITFHHT